MSGDVAVDDAADGVHEHRQGRGAPAAGGFAARFGQIYLHWLVPFAVILGAVLRTREWLYGKSLWLDELTVTDNLVRRGFSQLLEPLAGNQGGPIGWLWAERASIDFFGVDELSLRLVPWLGALVALAVFPLVARRLIGDVATPAATVLFATSPALIYYAAETKQYSTDVACALLVLLLTTRFSTRRPTLRGALLWGLACGVLVWCSQPTILIAAACGLFLALRWRRDVQVLFRLAAGGAVLAVSVGLEWLFVLRQLAANDELLRYWQAYGGYPPVPRSIGGDLRWAGSVAVTLTETVAQFWIPALAVVLAVWGLATLARLRPWSAVLIAVILLAAVGAAVAQSYPLAQRLALYLLPLIYLLVSAGLADGAPDLKHGSPRPWQQLAVGVCAAALLVSAGPAVVAGVSTVVRPDETTAGRQAIQFVADHQRPGDVVLAERYATSAMKFYGPRIGVPMGGVFSFTRPEANQGCAADPLAPVSDSGRVWFVFAHHFSAQPENRTEVYLSQVAGRATQLQFFEGAGDAGAYLYDFGQPATSSSSPLPSFVRNGCFTITR